MTASLIPLASPLIMALAGAIAFFHPGARSSRAVRLAEFAAGMSLLLGILSAYLLATQGPGTSRLLGAFGAGFSVLMDPLSVTMQILVSFIGWLVLRYSATYMEGEARQGVFTGWLCATLASVLFLVLAGNLVLLVTAWISISYFLRKLLLFYPQRPSAQRAAVKKSLAANLGASCLSISALLLAIDFRTADIATVLASAREGEASGVTHAAVALLVMAAVLKSAQFPLHGWLVEMMEAPTPVSALLHAGVVNAGGFLLIRFADVLLLSPGMLFALALIGGFTALFGGLVMLTQPAVKTSLAWSTVGQMGFMMLQCGLALFPLALLHVVAHSLYKAHAFLASGSSVERVAANRRLGPVAIPGVKAVGRAFVLSWCVYGGVGAVFGIEDKSPQAIALGGILIFGVAYLFAQGLADAAPRQLTLRTTLYSIAAALGYFGLQTLAQWLFSTTLPSPPDPGPLQWALIGWMVSAFGGVAVVQAMFPLWCFHPAAEGVRVHLSNGLYANALLDRALGLWKWPHRKTKAQG